MKLRPFYALLLPCVIALLVFLSGCSTLGKSDKKGIQGGTEQERNMLRSGLNDAYKHLKETGRYPRIKPYSEWYIKLEAVPAVGVEREGGVIRYVDGGYVVGSAYGSSKVKYARPVKGPTMFHEAIHLLMHHAGYVEESAAHQHPAFEHGGRVR